MELKGDIKFFYTNIPIPELNFADIQLNGYQLLRDQGFETEINISLFTDARANDGDKLPHPLSTKRGYYGDLLVDVPHGSRLWLLERSKLTNETLTLAKQYTEEALAYMIDDGQAKSITAITAKVDSNQMGTIVQITKPDGTNVLFKWFTNWEAQIHEAD